MSRTDALLYKWGAGIDPDLPAVARAHDEFLVTEDGTELVDAAAGAAVVNLGHSVPGVGDVVREQAEDVSYISLSHFTHDAPRRLAEQVVDLTPDGLSSVFYVNSGSEANETAFKLARVYHHDRGDPEKTKIISRWQSYHGATLGALAASGNTGRRRPYESLLKQWPKISPAYPYRWRFEGTPEEQALAAARELETTIRQEDPATVAAFVAEPVGGASIPAARPHPAYYREVRRICDEYDVLFVADEVMTGFGRTGPMFAVEHYDVVPDVLVLGKGLSSGYAPISAVVLHEDVAATIRDADTPFNHGHTYSGNPLSAAVAAHVTAQYDDDLLDAARASGDLLAAELDSLRDHPMVGDFRHTGLMVGIEFVADRETRAPFDPSLRVSKRVYDAAYDRGVYTYPGTGSADGVAGDHLMLSPPLTTSEASIRTIAAAVREAVDDVADQVAASADAA